MLFSHSWTRYFLFSLLFLMVSKNIYCQDQIYPENSIKAIIFDFSGVIVKKNREKLVIYVAHQWNISICESDLLLKELKAQSKLIDERSFWEEYSIRSQKMIPENWFTNWDQFKFDVLETIPGMIELITTLKQKGYIVGLLSNVSERQAEIKRRLGYYPLFNPILLSYQIEASKPDPKAYQILLKTLNLPPEAVLFIDNKSINVEGAIQMGIRGILFTDYLQLIQELNQKKILQIPILNTLEFNR